MAVYGRITSIAVLFSIAPACLAASDASIEEFVDAYCMDCHNSEDWAGGLAFDMLSLSDIHLNAEVFEKVVLKLQVGMMPPSSVAAQLPAEERTAVISELVDTLDGVVFASPDPGPTLLRRLNRTEYQNAVRDLLDLEIDAATLLPPDDSAFGFDNNAQALGVSPVLIEQYLSAAGKIAALAVGDQETGPSAQTFRIRQDASQNVPVQGMPVGTVGGGMLRTVAPLDGEYRLDVTFYKSNLGAMKGLELPRQLEISVDGERVHLAKLGGTDDFNALMQNITEAAEAIEERSSTMVALKAGPHDIGVGFLYEGASQNSQRLQGYIRSSQDLLDVLGHPHVETLTITGPYNASGPGDTPSRRRIFACRPESGGGDADAAERACAHEIVTSLARKAYRGLDTPDDVEVLMQFFELGREHNGFEFGIQTVVERLLASPKFVFRAERTPEGVEPGTIHKVSDHELASRLSFFL